MDSVKGDLSVDIKRSECTEDRPESEQLSYMREHKEQTCQWTVYRQTCQYLDIRKI